MSATRWPDFSRAKHALAISLAYLSLFPPSKEAVAGLVRKQVVCGLTYCQAGATASAMPSGVPHDRWQADFRVVLGLPVTVSRAEARSLMIQFREKPPSIPP